MKIYLLEQDLNKKYDTYDSCVVVAINEKEARKIHPARNLTLAKKGKRTTTSDEREWRSCESQCWVKYSQIKKIKVTYIGEAGEGVDGGVICASFNRG